jgi:hypothetical protein
MKESAKLKHTLVIPAAVSKHILEGFEPLLVTGELIDKHFMHLINHALSYVAGTSNEQVYIE